MDAPSLGNVLYLCDGRACENPDHCAHNGTGECRHTTKYEHAVNKGVDTSGFITRAGRSTGTVDLWEPFDG